MIGQWVGDHRDAVSTGVELLDQLITVLLSTSMFVSGFLGFLLDNTVPGEQANHYVKLARPKSIETCTMSFSCGCHMYDTDLF